MASKEKAQKKARRSKKSGFPVLPALILVLAAAVIIVLTLIFRTVSDRGADAPVPTPEPTELPATAAPTKTPTPEPTEEPTPAPKLIGGIPEELYYQETGDIASISDNSVQRLIASRVYVEKEVATGFERDADDMIRMPASEEYASVEGVVSFRGTNYRDGGSYGTIPSDPSSMSVVWKRRTGYIGEWTGTGWTGQASVVRWDSSLREAMNITASKKQKEGLTEVLYGTLDGKIYFFDLEDGEDTRKAIDIGAPIKGSLSVDPRGVPLLYCGQGIYEINGQKVKCGTRVWSLIDQKLLYAIDGDDPLALRKWRAFDSSPLVDAASDTLLQCGENGVLYTVKLNTNWDGQTVSVSPETVRYVYKQSLDGQIGTENSLAVYNHYAYFGNNTGIIQCVDLNTMQLVWAFDAKDDIDASLVIDVSEDGQVALYGGNEYDNRGSAGKAQLFKLDALTGQPLWAHDFDCVKNGENEAGFFATPAVGKQSLNGLVFGHCARTKDTLGLLCALDKETGKTVWEVSLGKFGWSSPTCLYSEDGHGYVLVGSASGLLRLFDGLTGEEVCRVDLEENIESTPVIFDDTIVVGTRGQIIYGVKIK